MSDLISRKAAIDALDRIFDRCEEIEAHLPEGDPDKSGYKMYPDYITVWKYLHQLPTGQPDLDTSLYSDGFVDGYKQAQMDAQEIIRCKDCLMHGVCRFEQGLGLDGYCSRAERREE